MSAKTILAAKHAACGYNPAPEPKNCGNCGFFVSDRVLPAWMVVANAKQTENGGKPIYAAEVHAMERNLRCFNHGFATKKTATCDSFRRRTVAAPLPATEAT